MPEPIARIEGVVAPLVGDDIDTDAIIPAQYMRSVSADQGEGLFARWRLLASGAPNPDFALNEPRYRGARILLSGANFGCGSSRENAVWALQGYGFHCVVALSFSDIFYDNAFRSGLLALRLAPAEHRVLVALATRAEALRATVELGPGVVALPGGERLPFAFDERRKAMLMSGRDEISLTEQREDAIVQFRHQQRQRSRWLYLDGCAATTDTLSAIPDSIGARRRS